MSGNKGIALIALIVLLIFASIIIGGVTSSVVQGVKLSTVKASQVKAVYLARAGVYAAIVEYQAGSLWKDVSGVNVAGNQYYSLGEDANFLLINASNPSLLENNEILTYIILTNINKVANIQINAITVSWTPDGGEVLTKINFDGGAAEWQGSAANGEEITLDYTFVKGNSYYFELTFGTGSIDMSGKTITADFTFSDNSERRMDLLVSGAAGNNEFSIKSTGEVRSDLTWRRTIEAVYDIGTGNITSWREVYSHLQ